MREQHVVDLIGGQSRPREQAAHDRRAELMGVERLEHAAEPPHRRSQRLADHDITQSHSPSILAVIATRPAGIGRPHFRAAAVAREVQREGGKVEQWHAGAEGEAVHARTGMLPQKEVYQERRGEGAVDDEPGKPSSPRA